MAYTYDNLFAVDPNNPLMVAANASITVFDVDDVTKTPVTLTDTTNAPIPNPVTVNKLGFGPKMKHETLDRLAWECDGLSGVITSYEGLKEEAVAARQAAEAAASTAGADAVADVEARIAAGEFVGAPGQDGSNVLPTDTAIKDAIENTGSATRGALNATYASRSQRENVASVLQKPLRVFVSDFETTDAGALRDWTSGHTGASTHATTPSTRKDGGNKVTLTDTEGTALALVKSKTFRGSYDKPQWFTTDEVVVSSGQQLSFQIASGVYRRGQILVTASVNSLVQINADDGLGAQTVAHVSSSTGFDATKPFRLGIWYDPRTKTARFYIFYDAGTSGAGTRHVYMGTRTSTTAPFQIDNVQFNTAQSNTGTATFARIEGYEVRGVLHGCSTDLPNNVYDTSPGIYPTQSRYDDAAVALAMRLWGQREGIVNMAHGAWAYSHMLAGGLSANGEDTATWANMVTALRPQFVVIGSAINSIAQVVTGSSSMLTVQGHARQMIDQALAAGAEFVVIRNCSPVGGHVATFNTPGRLDVVDQWNAWLADLPEEYPGRLVISDVWSKLNDPANPRYMLPRYDPGDHIHYTAAGAEALADADAAAILGS